MKQGLLILAIAYIAVFCYLGHVMADVTVDDATAAYNYNASIIRINQDKQSLSDLNSAMTADQSMINNFNSEYNGNAVALNSEYTAMKSSACRSFSLANSYCTSTGNCGNWPSCP
jgi:hypothetical protein